MLDCFKAIAFLTAIASSPFDILTFLDLLTWKKKKDFHKYLSSMDGYLIVGAASASSSFLSTTYYKKKSSAKSSFEGLVEL